MKRWLLWLCCVMLSNAVLAAGPNVVRKRVQASMLVTGTIEVTPEGSVAKYTLDHPKELPPGVRNLLGKVVPTWKFEPVRVNGKAVTARAMMSVRIVAKRAENDSYAISIAGTRFGDFVSKLAVKAFKQEKPQYPRQLLRQGVDGTVYLALRLNSQGSVVDAAAEQVNVGKIGSDAQLDQWRILLADAAIAAARHWTFSLPGDAAPSGRVIRMPVIFYMRWPGYGHWSVYVPGPVQPIPWLDNHNQMLSGDVDALPDGDVDLVEHGLHLMLSVNG